MAHLLILLLRGISVFNARALASVRGNIIELRLIAELGEVLVDLQLIFSESISVWSELSWQIIYLQIDLWIVVLSLSHIVRLLSVLECLVDDTVFFNLDLSLGNDSVLDHLAA